MRAISEAVELKYQRLYYQYITIFVEFLDQLLFSVISTWL